MRSFLHHRFGFSLLELSVALVVISLIVGFGMTGGRNALEGSDRVTTQERMATIQKALDVYAKLNGYLPCPARRDQIPTSSSFGMESRSGTACNAAGDIKSVPAAPSTPTIYIGGVPVRTLGLPDAYAADAWSNKFLYAVSMNHVGSNISYLTSDGPITVKYGNRSGTNYAITTARNGVPGAGATYVVISHGPDGKGAYTLSGTAVGKPCGNSTNNDVENCDELDATFFDTAYNTGSQASTFFDDYIVWASNALQRSSLVADTSVSGTCLSSGGTACDSAIANVGEVPDCDTICSTAGYSASGAQTSNCSYDSGCVAGGHLNCTYQCCCSGVPPAGCAATSVTWDSGHCGGDVPVLPHGNSVSVNNALAGYSGSETASCSNSVITYSGATCSALPSSSTSSSTSSSSSGAPAGCSSGNCERWCAPCDDSAIHPSLHHGDICQKNILSSDPCMAHCIYQTCARGLCSVCP